LESSRKKIGVWADSSTFDPFVMNASQSLFAAPKYPNPMAVLADACAAPALIGLHRTETRLFSLTSSLQLLLMGQ
jgi:hypothetical protein